MRINRFLSVLLTVVVFAIVSFGVLSDLDFSFALFDSFSIFGLVTFFTGLIFIIQRNFHSKKAINLQNMGTVFLFSFFIILINHFILSKFAYSIAYSTYLSELVTIKSMFILLLLSLFLFVFWIDEQKKQEATFESFVIEKEKDSGRIQLNSLQQQFKPHFLFNSLNSINALTISNPEEAQKMVHLLSEFMRGAVKEDQAEKVSLAHEIHHIQLYANIEKVRFGDRLNVDFSVPEECLSLKIPSLILQPIIENAIKYGLYGNINEVTIEISAELIKNRLVVSISNPYDEEIASEKQGTGYGLSSIRKKMLILYNQSSLLNTTVENGIFTTTLQIPQL